MPSYTKVSIILKDAPNHEDYNKRIIEYLNDRHTAINDNMFTIAIEVVDDNNLNDYVLQGMESVPAMLITQDEPYVYGVNSILSMLSKLEIIENGAPSKGNGDKMTSAYGASNDSSNHVDAFYNMALQEMKSDDQEDPDAPSSIKPYQQDYSESPLTEKMIEEKSQAYNKIYEERGRRNGKPGKRPTPSKHSKPIKGARTGVDVDKFIQSGGFDKGEEMLMRQIAQNLQ